MTYTVIKSKLYTVRTNLYVEENEVAATKIRRRGAEKQTKVKEGRSNLKKERGKPTNKKQRKYERGGRAAFFYCTVYGRCNFRPVNERRWKGERAPPTQPKKVG